MDPQFIVVDKPGGLLAVPGRGHDKQDCVESRVRKLFPDCIQQPAVHRLDMDTSGLMLLALTRKAHSLLSSQFAARLVIKHYLALLEGRVPLDSGEIILPFRLDPNKRPYQVYDPVRGKLGISRWRKLRFEGGRTWVEFTPLTGRTHQLRLHAAHEKGLQCPIVGDRLYGNGKPGDRLYLYASFLSFLHPVNGSRISFKSASPF